MKNANLLVCLIGLGVAMNASAQRPGTKFSLSAMAFTNSTKQGGQGPEGSTVLSHVDLIHHFDWFGIGMMGQFDLQGSAQQDMAFGPKFEMYTGVFYLEGAYLAMVQRSFTDRTIASDSGDGFLLGFGTRFEMGGLGGGGTGGGLNLFLQFSFKYRIQVIKKTDSFTYSQPIIQKDGYPVFGIGLNF